MNKEIYVFGSNEAGIHGAGSALVALKNYGAVMYQGTGLHGNSYAIPTKNKKLKTLPLSEIKKYVNVFIDFAKNNKNMLFKVVKIGCGLAGYKESDISPMFEDAPDNCILPEGW